jgi:hypothetical protein
MGVEKRHSASLGLISVSISVGFPWKFSKKQEK